MTDNVKALNYEPLGLEYGDIVRLTRAVRQSSGKRYKFLGAVYSPENLDEPEYLDLVEIGRGTMRSIHPDHVIKDVAATNNLKKRMQTKKLSDKD